MQTSNSTTTESCASVRAAFQARRPGHRATVQVPLPGPDGAFATVDAEDWERLKARGFSPRWQFNTAGDRRYSYVRTYLLDNTGALLTVARVIMDAPAGAVVKHVNGDRTDLRRSNLYLTNGFSKGNTREAMARAAAVPRASGQAT